MTTALLKPVRRRVHILGRGEYVVEIAAAGIELRQAGRRFRVSVDWGNVLARAERLAGEAARREKLRA